MKRLAAALFAAALLASIASTAFAYVTYPPGPPYRTCPDSVTIFQVQRSDTTINPCYPAINDTLKGMRGIIIGFRPRSTGRMYIENSNGADYNGVQIYTQNVHYETAGFAIGDSVSMAQGLMGSYQGENQIAGNTFIKIGKISSGNPLPPFRVGTTTSYKWTPVPTSHPGLPSVGSLVRVEGPLRVARRGPGAGLPGAQNYLLVNGDGSNPGDSLTIDGYTLTPSDIVAPPLGYTVNWVQGILRRAAPGGTDYLCISLRDQNDVSVAAPPNLVDAYPVADNVVRLKFDANLDVTTAENEANYALGSGLSGSTVDLATVVGGSGTVVDVTVTEVLPRMSVEAIQIENIGSEVCPSCLATQQSRTFILGVLTIAEVQAPLEDSLAAEPCLDKSRFSGPASAMGERCTVRGVLSARYVGDYYMADAASGLRSGVDAYNIPFAVTVGNQYLLACRVQEYYGMTELNNPVAIIDEGPVGAPPPTITTLAKLSDVGCDPNQDTENAEDYECMLVGVQSVKVVPFNTEPVNPSQGGDFRICGPMGVWTDTLLVNNVGDTYPDFTPVVGMLLNVNGSFYFTNDRPPQIYPRNASDITVIGQLGVQPTNPLVLSLSVKPNPGVSHRVSFTVPRKDKVEVGIYDLAGRRVALLARGEMPAGEYTRNWDGRTTDGAKATAGVYFYRLTVGSEMRTFRAVKLN